MDKEIKIVRVPIDDLKPADYNPRKASEKSINDIKQSIKEFGLVEPIVVNSASNRHNIIIGGHLRQRVAKMMGFTEMPVVYVNIPDIKKERELNLRLNKNLGEWDYDLLANFDEEELNNVGFESEELDKIFQLDSGEDDFDAEAEAEKIIDPSVKTGDLYQLGEHKLLCGDSTKREDVEKLMGGEKADMVFTDPPYNVDYSGQGKKTSNKIENDNQTETAFRDFLEKAFNNYFDFTKEDSPLYTCYASRTHREFEDSLNKNNWEVKNQIIWVKLVASMGWGDYRWKHEPILYCHKKGNPIDFYGDRSQYTEWHEELSDNELLNRVKKLIKKEEDGGSTIWRLHRDKNYDHPTQKPLKLVKIALTNSSKREDIVLDLFGGSGSTLIACEQLNRKCYMCEIDNRYVSVILDRWMKLTNKIPIRLSDGKLWTQIK